MLVTLTHVQWLVMIIQRNFPSRMRENTNSYFALPFLSFTIFFLLVCMALKP